MSDRHFTKTSGDAFLSPAHANEQQDCLLRNTSPTGEEEIGFLNKLEATSFHNDTPELTNEATPK